MDKVQMTQTLPNLILSLDVGEASDSAIDTHHLLKWGDSARLRAPPAVLLAVGRGHSRFDTTIGSPSPPAFTGVVTPSTSAAYR
jgi:hypothetical protein